MKMVRTTSAGIYLLARRHLLKQKQLVLYAVIGLSGVAIDYIFYALGVKFLGLGVLLANFISVSLGIVNNFVLNTRYNFKVSDRLLVRFAIFYFVGFLGLLFSDVLLIIFRFGFNIGPLYAKLFTLPFVLLGQFVLNRAFSFGSVADTLRLGRKVLVHWPAYTLAILFFCCSLMFVRNLPINFSHADTTTAPDEGTHYGYNVQFILEHKRLPVSGKDDISAYKSCRNNPSAIIPCVYSYEFYPGPNYVVSAVSASLFSKAMHIAPQIGSRIPGMVYGTLFVLCTYFSTWLLARSRRIAALLTFGVCFIPQLLFTSSYTNLDAHSIAISGVLCLAFVAFIQQPQNRRRAIILAVTACGLLPLAKYNYFILFIPVAAAVAWLAAKKRITKQQLLTMLLWGVGSFVLLASFWYIRNYLLYKDAFGQTFAVHEMTKYHKLGSPLPSGAQSLIRLTDMNFFNILFRSFYLTYGAMFYFLPTSYYIVPAFSLVFGGVVLANAVTSRKTLRPLLWAGLAYVGLFLLALVQVFYNSAHYDFQPQGRYMFPILLPTALLCAYAFRKYARLSILSILFASSTLFIFINGAELFIKIYLKVVA